MATYPNFWPRPNPRKPNSAQTRVTEQQKEDLYNRRLTTRDLAKLLDIHERYASFLFPGKAPVRNRKVLMEARKAYKLEIARQVLNNTYTIGQAAKVAHVSYNTMHRFVAKAKLQQEHSR